MTEEKKKPAPLTMGLPKLPSLRHTGPNNKLEINC